MRQLLPHACFLVVLPFRCCPSRLRRCWCLVLRSSLITKRNSGSPQGQSKNSSPRTSSSSSSSILNLQSAPALGWIAASTCSRLRSISPESPPFKVALIFEIGKWIFKLEGQRVSGGHISSCGICKLWHMPNVCRTRCNPYLGTRIPIYSTIQCHVWVSRG